ncbi:hypothetical protein P691DRAFT_811990 [Macrolepiota fuliginosa MF-IS2]|uniref:Uncharacterized protein n=1 Tax=Macrolepiota fuliginosa MF-IS2 TaxID=1400762 RepID=A0A9P5XE47_9AGAR|nr:hypothetical protein P691DRAFT_811990 [Macrolepiota fuliginosa MF-IS2]
MANPGSRPFGRGSGGRASADAMAAALMIGEQALNMLQNASNYVPVPGIAVAAGLALSIITIAQNVKSNKEDFTSIGKESCFIVVAVIERVKPGQGEQFASASLASLQQDAEQLVSDMQSIETRVKKHRKRSLMKRILNNQADQAVILECRNNLQHAISLFGQMPQPHIPQPYTQPHPPQPQFQPPAPHTSGRSEARAERRQARQNQQLMNVAMGGPGGPPTSGSSSFANVQNHIGPGSNVTYSYVGGDQHNNNRDDSFNVSGSGHNINFAFAPR